MIERSCGFKSHPGHSEMNENKIDHMIEQKFEDIMRKLANDPKFAQHLAYNHPDIAQRTGNKIHMKPDQITGKVVFDYMTIVLAVRMNMPINGLGLMAAQALTNAVFGDCERLAEMLRNYIADAQESGSSMKVGEIRIHSEFDKLFD